MTAPTVAQPLEEYGLIGDLHTLALVSRHGDIDWLCLPRFDSGACFAALLGDEEAGRWSLRPQDPDGRPARDYLGDSLALRTRWRTATGQVDVIDFMPPRGEAAVVVRLVEGVKGHVDMSTVLALRFDYGRTRPWVGTGDEGSGAGHHRAQGPIRVEALSGPHAVRVEVRGPGVQLVCRDGKFTADFSVGRGDRVSFVMTYQLSHLPWPRTPDPERALRGTRAYWEDWIARCSYTGPWQRAVHRSLALLKALTYAPTGGILAAGTTSLPEDLGGVRNWDYRYCWLRDAAFTLQALLGTGFVEEARAWREWLVRAIAGDPSQLQIMYALDGSPRLPETTLDWLSGYAGSRPVRVGNAAADQLQIDVWGEVLDGLYLSRRAGLEITRPGWDVQRELMDWLEGNWMQADNGLWEVRGQRRHFVHSKVMAWVGVDRAVHTVEERGLDGPAGRWRALRDRIHAEVCQRGYDARRGTFTQFYGSAGLDASLLLIPRVGFLPWSDERVVRTVDAVQRELSREGFLLRYDPEADGGVDELPAGEGVFLACSFWLADALQGVGRRDEAVELFERLLAVRNDLGLLSEEYDPVTGRHLGNTPQAFSLVGLVNTALHLGG